MQVGRQVGRYYYNCFICFWTNQTSSLAVCPVFFAICCTPAHQASPGNIRLVAESPRASVARGNLPGWP